MTAEPPKPGVAGVCDYARNDEVEDPTLCGEYRDVTLRASPCVAGLCDQVERIEKFVRTAGEVVTVEEIGDRPLYRRDANFKTYPVHDHHPVS